MKKCVVGIFFALVLCLAMLPMAAFAEALASDIAGTFAVCLADTFFVLLFFLFQLQLAFFLFLAACSMQAVHSGDVFYTESGCQYGDLYFCIQ